MGEHKLNNDCMEICNKERHHTLCVENSFKANQNHSSEFG